MGCPLSKTQDEDTPEQMHVSMEEVTVFFPALRFPKAIDFSRAQQGHLSSSIIQRLAGLRGRIFSLISADLFSFGKTKKKVSSHGTSNIGELQKAVEDYLPMLIGLTVKGCKWTDMIEFSWTNREDESKETTISSALYELLSVLHLIGTLSLLEANIMLTPRSPVDGYRPKITEESKKAAIESLLKAAQVFDYAATSVLKQLPDAVKANLPKDLKEAVLRALEYQALGQGVDIQLGLAIDNVKATLAVKRRLACEQVKYWEQAYENIQTAQLANGWGEKHGLFIKWKRADAKAAAYYFHGLILDEGTEENTHAKAVFCLQAAEGFINEGKKLSAQFNAASPVTRPCPIWGAMKYLTEKIPKDAISKARVNKDVYYREIAPERVPDLPDFPLALKPDEYELPSLDVAWSQEQ